MPNIIQEGEKLDKIKNHLKNNWKKYALGAAVVGAGGYVGKKANDAYNSPGIMSKAMENIRKDPNKSEEEKRKIYLKELRYQEN
jgi:predicted negative regulator of RcsB-dependent stress response